MQGSWETDSICSRNLVPIANYYLGVAAIRIT